MDLCASVEDKLIHWQWWIQLAERGGLVVCWALDNEVAIYFLGTPKLCITLNTVVERFGEIFYDWRGEERVIKVG